MFTKIILISLALAQVVWANPIVEDDLCLMKTKYGVLLSSEKDNELPASTQLFKFSINGLLEIFQNYAKGGKVVSEQLLKEPEIIASTSGRTYEFKQNLTKFEENYAKCDGFTALTAVATFYFKCTTLYFNDDQTTFDDEAKQILALLLKYKSEDLHIEFAKHFDAFVVDFDDKFNSLKEDLVKEESQQSKKLLDWFTQFKTLDSLQDKFDVLSNFYEVYGKITVESNKLQFQ